MIEGHAAAEIRQDRGTRGDGRRVWCSEIDTIIVEHPSLTGMLSTDHTGFPALIQLGPLRKH